MEPIEFQIINPDDGITGTATVALGDAPRATEDVLVGSDGSPPPRLYGGRVTLAMAGWTGAGTLVATTYGQARKKLATALRAMADKIEGAAP